MIKKLLAPIFSLLILLSLGAKLLYAQPPTGSSTIKPPTGTNAVPSKPPAGSIPNPFRGGDNLFAFIKTLVNDVVLPIGGVIAVLGFIYSGFLYVLAQGKPTEIAKANNALLFTAIGTVILLGAWVLANVICRTINQLGGPVCPT